jgi:hypothetical protein
MSATIFGSASATGAPTKPFEVTDSRERAFTSLLTMLEAAQSKSLLDFVKSDVEPIMLEEPETLDAGATTASRAQYEILLKKAKDQKKDIAALMGILRPLVSESAWAMMLHLTKTSIFATLNPRQVIRKFKEAFCVLTGEELIDAQIVLQTEWVVGTSITDHVSKHKTAREYLEMGGTTSNQKEQVRALELSLRNLFTAGMHYEAKDAIAREHFPQAEAADAFAAYAQILLLRDRSGQFRNATKPTAKVNALKECSAGGAGDFHDRSKAAKHLHSAYPLDKDCPMHTHPNKDGKLHKWRDCSLFTGKQRVVPNGK